MHKLAYPLHYFVSRPYTRSFLRELEAPAQRTRGFRETESVAINALAPYLQLQSGDPLSIKVPATLILAQELQGALAWGEWALKGRRIVSVCETLGHAFEHSDISDMRILDVLPEDVPVYLNFEGKLQTPIALDDGAYFEGAYILHTKDTAARIVLCARTAEPANPTERWKERYDLRISSRYLTVSADEAIDLALSEDLADLEHAKLKLRTQGHSSTTELAVETLKSRMLSGHSAFRNALRLILNALAYLKNYSSDSRTGWPAQAPQRLVRQAEEGSATEKVRGLSKLWGLGFVPVTYLGEQFAETILRNGSAQQVRSHWRRGHWRNQPYGPAMTLRKLIWLQPTMVGGSVRDAPD